MTQREGKPKKAKVEKRPDLEDPDHGRDLSYLNEFPQYSVDEGVKAGVPPPKKALSKNEENDTY